MKDLSSVKDDCALPRVVLSRPVKEWMEEVVKVLHDLDNRVIALEDKVAELIVEGYR